MFHMKQIHQPKHENENPSLIMGGEERGPVLL